MIALGYSRYDDISHPKKIPFLKEMVFFVNKRGFLRQEKFTSWLNQTKKIYPRVS